MVDELPKDNITKMVQTIQIFFPKPTKIIFRETKDNDFKVQNPTNENDFFVFAPNLKPELIPVLIKMGYTLHFDMVKNH